jgi:hypothetical protein
MWHASLFLTLWQVPITQDCWYACDTGGHTQQGSAGVGGVAKVGGLPAVPQTATGKSGVSEDISHPCSWEGCVK